MSLPPGLPAYEFKRRLVPSSDLTRYWHLRVDTDAAGIPALTEDGRPKYTPLDIPEFFGAPAPIEVEIGCGKGGFMVEYAERHPAKPFLAVEWEPEIAFFAAGRIHRRPALSHVRVVLGDCFYLFRDWLPPACVGAFHMYFPDPWPKKRHRKHRLMKPAFLEQVRRLAAPGARFHWATDFLDYHQETLSLFAATPWLSMLDPEAPPTEGIQTNFEKKYREEGRPIYRCVLAVAG